MSRPVDEHHHPCGCPKWRKVAVFVTPVWFTGPNYLDMMRKEDVEAFYDIRVKVARVLQEHAEEIHVVIDTWNGTEGLKYWAPDSDHVVIAWVEWVQHHRKHHPDLPRYLVHPDELVASDPRVIIPSNERLVHHPRDIVPAGPAGVGPAG